MDQLKMSVIKQEFDDDLTTPLEGWSAVTGDTTSSSSLSTTPSQSVLNLVSPPAKFDHSTASRSSNVNETYPNIASISANSPNARQGLVKNVERNNNRPLIAARNNKFGRICSKLKQTNTALPFNFEYLFKQTQEQMKELTDKLVDSRNAYSILEKKYGKLKLENAKLHDEIKQLADHQVTLMAQMNAQTPTENSQSTGQLYSNEQTVDNNFTKPDLLYNLIEIGQNVDFEYCPSLPNGTEMQIKQEFSDDNSASNEASDILSRDQLKSNNNSVSQCIATVNEHASPSSNGQIDVINSLIDESGHYKLNIANGNNHQSVVEYINPSTSAQQQTNPIASIHPTGSNRTNHTKRKQSQFSNCSEKRSNKTVEDEGEKGEEDIAKDNRADDDTRHTSSSSTKLDRIITHTLRCPQVNCPEMITKEEFHHHLWEEHSISPFRCLVKDCAQSFDNAYVLRHHIGQSHQSTSQWHCDKCSGHFTSYKLLSNHTDQLHQLGHFQCSFPSCTFTGEYKQKMFNHARQHKQTIRHIRKHFPVSPSLPSNEAQLVDPCNFLVVVQ